MALFVVATPIGHPADITLRALETLKSADLVIGEELKALRQILKAAGIQAGRTDQLNEHSRPEDIEYFVGECRDKTVALVSDCGTPGVFDPGAELVSACRRAGIGVHPVPGASSVTALLSVAGVRLTTFVVYGFLPANKEERARAWRDIARESRPCVILETPYRGKALAVELGKHLPERRCVLGLDLTLSSERIWEGQARDLAAVMPAADVEPVALILPADHGGRRDLKGRPRGKRGRGRRRA